MISSCSPRNRRATTTRVTITPTTTTTTRITITRIRTNGSPRRVLFLTAAVGGGHIAAARAVGAELAKLDPPVESEIVDSYRYAASVFSKVVADGYIGMVKTVPQLYRVIYDRAERAKEAGTFRKWLSAFTAANLREVIERTQPDAVVCTHAFPCGVMAAYKQMYAPELPVVGVVTDFVVHPFWIYRNIDAYAVATAEMRSALLARGVRDERILISGIPVDRRFGQPTASRAELRARLDLPADRKIVLMMGGGLGIGPLDVMMRALGELEEPIAGAIIIGKNRRIERRVLDAAERIEYPLRVRSFVDNVFDYMHASDVLLSKPGGLTSSEALAARLPMVLVKPLPGQEERNTRYLVSRKAAIRAAGPRGIGRAVSEVLGSGPTAQRVRASIEALRRPDAARDVAERVSALAPRRA
jgi:processive 1,2-diacylglycerol beta-glucosyltransferase